MRRITPKEAKNLNQGDNLHRIKDGHLLFFKYICPHPFMNEMHILARNEIIICVSTADIQHYYFHLDSKDDAKKAMIEWHKEAVKFWEGYYDDEIEQQ